MRALLKNMRDKILGPVAAVTRQPLFWLAVAFLAAAGAGLGLGAWRNLCADCPSIAQIYTYEPQQTSKVFSRTGELIAELGIERRTPVSIEALPEFAPRAFLAIEDKRFYEHGGFDVLGIARAVLGVLTGQNRGGGSTITQQLARNMWPENIGFERRYVRKLKELQVALALERAYEKDQILEAYMNQVNFDVGYGIQTASRNYFGKNAAELNPAEAALLAAIPRLPRYYNPFRRPDNARGRRNLVLGMMADQGFLPADELERWREWPLPEPGVRGQAGLAPYFEEWVRRTLDDRFGSQLYTAGLRVYTTLDVRMQAAAQEAMNWGWARLEEREEYPHPLYEEFVSEDEVPDFPSGLTPYAQGMFVALDPATGAVRALIGGRDFDHSKFNRATQAQRQAGSSFKPFVYTSAIASGIPASHVLVDAPVVMEQVDGTEWRPQNFTDEFQGPITMREGLRRSINMIAIKVGLEVGLETVAQTARRMGLRTEIERFPSTAIGAAEVIPLQMVEAYSGFATLGTKVRAHGIVRVESAEGEVLWEPKPERTEVLDSLVARVMVSMLEDVVRAGTGYTGVRLISGLPTEVPAAGKTGTTNNSTDVWFLGFTPNLVAGVWLGMDQPQQIRPRATGGGDASPIWGRFMRTIYYGTPEGETEGVGSRRVLALEAGTPQEGDSIAGGPDGDPEAPRPVLPIPDPWPMLPGLTTRLVDSETGLLASEWCPEDRRYVEIYIPGTEPTEVCDDTGPTIIGASNLGAGSVLGRPARPRR